MVENMDQFVPQPIRRSYAIKGQSIELQLEPDVFSPSSHGSLIGNYIDIAPAETVLDMGTGTGILGIIAAKEGGIVDVSDSSSKAVNLALRNASLNNVSVRGYVGEYFCTPREEYDYIIANLPQEIVPEGYRKRIGEREKTMSGGPNGNKHLLTFLDQARLHMHENSRALVAIYSVSDYITTLGRMRSLYAARLLDVIISPAKSFVQEHILYYREGIRTGEVGLFEKDGVWQSTILVYELRKK